MLVDEHSWPEWVTFSTTATTGRCPWLACVAAPTVYCLFIRTFSSFICHPISSQNEPLQAVWVLDHSDTRRPPCLGGSCGTVSVDHLGRLENLVCVTSWCGRWAKPVDVAAGTEKKKTNLICAWQHLRSICTRRTDMTRVCLHSIHQEVTSLSVPQEPNVLLLLPLIHAWKFAFLFSTRTWTELSFKGGTVGSANLETKLENLTGTTTTTTTKKL